MVKNTTGGSKHKGQARKFVNAPISNKIRYSEDEDECYGIVVKMLGNGMCHVNILHKDNILNNVICHIRKKFRGRHKSSNFVNVGSIVLVGLRSFTSKNDSSDLLCIYNDSQIPSLNLPNSLLSNQSSHSIQDDSFEFSNDTSTNSFDYNLSPLNNHNDTNLNDIDLDAI
jgi:translation initiation factor IF-1